jgi:putative tricarboxylic transport membrane protein
VSDILANAALGFGIALSWNNLLFCLIGVTLGTAIGVLPGLGPAATIALLLPITYRMDAVASLILLAGIYYGAMYGGSITSILVKVPGEGASVITCLDGYAMARKGRAGAALGLSAVGSFIAGIIGTVGVFLLGPPLASVALAFGPAEYAALVVVGLVLVTHVAQSTPLASLLMIAAGLLLATLGVDPIYGTERFTFGQLDLFDGVPVAILAMGVFGVAELLAVASSRGGAPAPIYPPGQVRELLPSREEWRESAPAIARGTGLGFFLGLLPGGGALIASFASYVIEKRLSPHPERFGQGAPAGVAGPESANNAAAQAAFVPLLSLGIPANVVMGVMMGGLLIQGIQPGPRLLATRPDLYWAVICSMLIGNVMLIILNVPLISIFVQLLRIPFRGAIALDHPVLRHRGVLAAQQRFRCRINDRLRCRRLAAASGEVRSGPAGPRFRPRRHPGALGPPGAACRARLARHLRAAPDRGGAARLGDAAAAVAGAEVALG